MIATKFTERILSDMSDIIFFPVSDENYGDMLVNLSEVRMIIASGENRSTIVLKNMDRIDMSGNPADVFRRLKSDAWRIKGDSK